VSDPATATSRVPSRRRGGRPPIDSPERLISQPVRLRMLLALSGTESMTFTRLRDIVSTNYGNLSLHARRLESFGYIKIEKTFVHRIPRTVYYLTASGRSALRLFLADRARLDA
jgi:DNA-binding MarR family transcriptional regulator